MLYTNRRYCDIGDFFKHARKSKGLSQEELSELARVSTRHLTNIENEKINPSCTMMRQLIEVLHVDISPLFYKKAEAKLPLEAELLDIFRRCDGDSQQKLVMIAKCFLKRDAAVYDPENG